MAERIMQPDISEIHISHKLRYQLAKRFIDENMEVLDYGCGVGYGSWMLAPYCNRIVAMDKSQEAIEYAKKYYKRDNLYFSQSVEPPTLMQFDFITAFEVVEHVESSDLLMRQLFATLKPGCKMLISVPNDDVVKFDKADPRCEFHYRHFTPESLKQLIDDSGFELVKPLTQHSKPIPKVVPGWWGYTLIALLRKP